MGQRLVVIGGDAAGMSAASKAKRMSPDTEVIVLEKGEYISYAACGIPYYIGGVVKNWEDLIILNPKAAREGRKIDVRLKHLVEHFDPKTRIVKGKNLEDDSSFEFEYDKLIIATGARPIIPKIQGMDLPGVFTLRSIDDGRAIKNYIEE
ncbi:MAG: FAD-dependent oxidoreductase, partial [Candidatus Marinimicrobia bacterium]|nr:FAD-dependent oxidoreductase [Candidatus Neomarinimicrobiota bacterium]